MWVNAKFPSTRLRRNRQSLWLRDLVAEHDLSVRNLIWPLFVSDKATGTEPITAMPGVVRHSLHSLLEAASKAADLGIPAVALFPNTPTDVKSHDGAEAYNPENLICKAVHAIKRHVPSLGVICDVALDPYTTHGHDGLLIDGKIANDATLEVLCRQAVVQAQAGCDVIAPSDMMDGRVGAIREALDSAGFHEVTILAYAAKYASAFYGPFREAVGSQSNLGKGDKKTYQMDPRNSAEALREVALDIEEGADMVMVKPGMPYLDIIHRIKSTFGVPTFAYQVSGEYSMIQAAAQQRMIDGNQAMLESLMCFRRAGADAVLTYAAADIAALLGATGH